MAILNSTEITRFRRKIGDAGVVVNGQKVYAFSPSEIQDIYQESGENFNGAVLIAFDELIGNSWKFNDYTQNQSQEKKQQIFANLLKARDNWDTNYVSGVASKPQVRVVGISTIPRRIKESPNSDSPYPLLPDEWRNA